MIENSLKSNTNQVRKIRNKKILLVDSSQRIRDALSFFFEFEECDFIAVDTPEAALNILQNETYDIIISDYYFSGPNGLEFLNDVKSNFPKTIKILTTSYGDRKLVEAAKEAGISDVIQKPFSAETLMLHLLHLLEPKKQ